MEGLYVMNNVEYKFQGDLKKGNYKLSKKIKKFSYENIPNEVKAHSKVCLLDLLGAILGGSITKPSDYAKKFVKKVYPGEECTVIGKSTKSNVIGATFANAFSANAIDIDDGYRPVKGHPGALVIPAALAVAEWANKSGKELMESIILGYEIGTRAGIVWHDYYPVYHSSGAWGTIASAAVTAKLLNFDVEEIYNALGTAEWRAPMNPMMRCIDYPSMSKDGIGWGSPTGVESALMAKEGFTGCPSLFGYPKYNKYIESLGEEYNILKLYFKPFACCRWAQPGIIGTLKILGKNNLAPEDINKIKVYTFKESSRLSTDPPSNADEAQYNIAYPIAVTIVDGKVGPKQLVDEKLKNTIILGLMNKIEIISDSRFDKKFPQNCESEVEITDRKGNVYISGHVQAKGDWDNPLSKEEILNKFKWLAEYSKSEQQIERIIDMINNIEKLRSVKDLMKLL